MFLGDSKESEGSGDGKEEGKEADEPIRDESPESMSEMPMQAAKVIVSSDTKFPVDVLLTLYVRTKNSSSDSADKVFCSEFRGNWGIYMLRLFYLFI